MNQENTTWWDCVNVKYWKWKLSTYLNGWLNSRNFKLNFQRVLGTEKNYHKTKKPIIISLIKVQELINKIEKVFCFVIQSIIFKLWWNDEVSIKRLTVIFMFFIFWIWNKYLFTANLIKFHFVHTTHKTSACSLKGGISNYHT